MRLKFDRTSLFPRFVLAFLFLLINISTISAQKQQVTNIETGEYNFTENKGQWKDKDQAIKFIFSAPNLKVAFAPDGFTYSVFSSVKSFNNKEKITEKSKIAVNRVKVNFRNGNPNTQILAEEKLPFYNSFYNQHTGANGVEAHSYKKLIYKNVWPHIDIVFHVQHRSLKYDIVINPGGNIEDVKLQYYSAQKLRLAANNLQILQGAFSLRESIPYSYNGDEKNALQVNYDLNGDNVVGFQTGEYNKQQKLVIDPMLSWATYIGGNKDDRGKAVAADTLGNAYAVGYAESSGLATGSAYQDTVTGGMDGFIIKFDSSGKRVYSTYYGGENDDIFTGITMNKKGNIVVIGTTLSTKAIATKGAHKETMGSSTAGDAMLITFNGQGKRIWGTYYGGNSAEYIGKPFTDDSCNIYIGGTTFSTQGISTPDAYQTSISNPGGNDCFLAKLDSSGNRIWGTYYGGKYAETGNLCLDKKGNIYLVGETNSPDKHTTTGAFQTTLNGKDDIFIAKFTNQGNRIWGTYFGGPEDGDMFATGAVDKNGQLYVFFQTDYWNNKLATPGAHQETYTVWVGRNDAPGVLAKFDTSGKRIWSTFIAGSSTVHPQGIAVDDLDNVFVSGYSASSNIATKGAYQEKPTQPTTTGGVQDAFLMKFNPKGVLQWGTFYGGEVAEEAPGICSDHHGNIFLCGYTNSDTLISTSGAFQTKFSGIGGPDFFIAKFNDPGYNCQYNITMQGPDSVCFGETSNYRTQKMTGATYTWSTYNASFVGGWNADTLKIKWNKYKEDLLKVLVRKTDFCADADFKMVKISNLRAYPGTASSICPGDSIQIGSSFYFDAKSKYSWRSKPEGFTSDNVSPVVKPSTTTTYYITESNNVCSRTDSVTITVYDKGIPGFKVSKNCFGESVAFTDTSKNGTSYEWYFGDGTKSTSRNPVHVYKDTGTYTVKQILYWGKWGFCSDFTVKEIYIAPKPIAGFESDTVVCAGQKVNFKNTSVIHKDTIATLGWLVNSTLFSTDAVVTYTFPTPGTYAVTLNITTQNGCKSSITKSVKVLENPVADFKFSNACSGREISFTNNSTINTDTIIAWLYTFEDGKTSTDKNPKYTFTNSGVYNVKLSVITSSGCIGTITKNVIVTDTPKVDFTANISGNKVNFRVTDSLHKAYSWDFGDGKNSTQKNPEHIYNGTGSYHVKLTVTSAGGCETIVIKTVNIINTAIKESMQDEYIEIFPNPFNEQIIVRFKTGNKVPVKFSLLDFTGKTIFVMDKVYAQENQILINLQNKNLPAGIYSLAMDFDNEVKYYKVIKL